MGENEEKEAGSSDARVFCRKARKNHRKALWGPEGLASTYRLILVHTIPSPWLRVANYMR